MKRAVEHLAVATASAVLGAAASRVLQARRRRLASYPAGLAKAVGMTERNCFRQASLRYRATTHRTAEQITCSGPHVRELVV